LVTNLAKTCYYPISCEGLDLQFLSPAGRIVSNLSCTYLGLPLHFKRLNRATLQPLVQKIGRRVPRWKRDFFSYPRRELLVKSVLPAMPTHFITVFKMPKWTICGIDKFRRSFLWRGTDPENIRGGHCLVNWETCLRPKKLGGLVIKDIENFNRALRLKWLWYAWDSQDRQWKMVIKINDSTNKALFFNSTYINIGDGRNTPFWEAKWLQRPAPKDIAPSLHKKAWFKRTIYQELNNDN
jgi:hypothetical protein